MSHSKFEYMPLSYKIHRFLIAFCLVALSGLSAFAQPLNGTYTVGGTTPNYAHLAAAVADLTAKGVSGPVTLNIRNGSYTGANWRPTITNITGASNTNRITIKSETNNAANVSLSFANVSANNFVIRLNGASYVTIRDLTLVGTGTTYGRVIAMSGAASYDSIINCTLEGPVRTSSSVNTAVIHADITGGNNAFIGNTILNGSYGIYYSGASTTNLTQNPVFYNNTIKDVYQYSADFYNTNDLKFINNTIIANSSSSTSSYAVREEYGDGALEIVGNKISGLKAGYGLYLYYNDGTPAVRGIVANNVINIGSGVTTTTNGIRNYYSSYQRIYNNTVNITNTSTTTCIPGYFRYDDAAHTGNEIRNNVFSNNGGGYAMYVYDPFNYNNSWDYNNLFVTGNRLVDQGLPTADYANLTAWRAATGHDMNSLVYNPGFISATNLAPNPASANAWSLNGRGVQIPGNDKDINGNARATTVAAGVPDIGAFEFTPTSVPPNTTPFPALPAAGTTQTFLLGEDTVATITWDATSPVPPGITFKQYTGTVPPTINTISANNMFFYTDLIGPAGNYNFSVNIYYKDPWMGTAAAETGLILAHKDATTWTTFPSPASFADAGRNFISGSNLSLFGSFTGVDVANNASASEITEPLQYFCTGTFPVKVRIKNTGNNVLNSVQINWELDGVLQTPISYTTPISVQGETIITLGSFTFNNIPKNFKVWTSLPNGVPDLMPGDDTIERKLSGGLAGVYTVGGTTPNFTDVKAANDALIDFGVCGPVVFNIRDGNYTNPIVINAPVDGMSATNRVTWQSESGNAGAVVIDNAGTGSKNYVVRLKDASFFTFRNLSFTNTNATFGRVVEMIGNGSNDSILNCVLTGPVVTVSNVNTAVLFATDYTGTNNVFTGNTIQNGSYGVYYRGTSTTVKIGGAVFEKNSLLNQFTYGAYFYYTDDLKFRNNIVNTNSTDNVFYGVYSYYGDDAFEVVGNKLLGFLGGYGLYLYNSDGTATKRGIVANNVISFGAGTNTAYGIRSYTSSYQSIYNNSVNITSGDVDGAAGYFYYSGDNNNIVQNNVLANNGGGYAMYVYEPVNDNVFDFNNLYTTGPKLVDQGTPATDYATLQAWRTAFGLDMNSIAHDPGFTSATDLRPNDANPASWSLNGRGVHMSGNDKDINGTTRITAMANGVPDIGAYEFTPIVTPPSAVATPALPVAGTQQVFTFGQDTVAVINWKPNSVVPTTIHVRQYTDTKPQQFPVPGFMYFYTDIDAQNATYEMDAEIFYKDPWRGTTSTEGNLRMARKTSSSGWQAYNDNVSSVNIGRNVFSAPITGLGSFTGIENGAIFSAVITPIGSTVFCPGNSATLQANTGAGYSYQWQYNGSDIPGATSATYVATAAGDYTVRITNSNNVTATSLSVGITIVSPPSAVINANGPLNYCPGGALTLLANTGNGLSYQWQLNGTDIPGATTDTQPVTSAGSYSVTVTNIGCATTSPLTVVAPGPLSVDLGVDTSFCQSQPLMLDAGHPGATYLWSTGENTQQINVVSQSGKYWVFVDAGPNCQATDTIDVQIAPLPFVTGISSVNKGNGTYDFSPSGAQNVDSYLWIFSDGTTSTAKDVSHTFSISEQNVKLVVFNACGSDTTKLDISLSVNDTKNNNIAFNLYPNPANDYIKVKLEGNGQIESVVIVNSVGGVVYRSAEASLKSSDKTIDVSSLPVGYYILRAHTSEGVISKPFNVLR